MKKKKILFFLFSLWENRWTEKLFSQLSYKLEEKYDIFFVSLYDISPYSDFTWTYISLHQKNKINIFSFLKNIFTLRKIITQNGIQRVIWTNDLLNIILLFATIFLKIKKIWTIHSNPLLHANNKIKKLIIEIFYPCFSKVVCVSQAQEKIMKDNFKLKNTITIYNFFNIKQELWKFEQKIINSEQYIFEKKFNFLMISRLDRLKGFIPTLRIFNKLNSQYKNISLTILWEWEYRESIEKYIINNNLGNNIHLLGSKKNIYPYLLQSDCFLFPSLTEAFWLVLIEALLANKIIVSSDCNIWPKEILHPDYSQEINQYPFYWDYWLLIESFTEEDLKKYEQNIESDLDNKEIILYKLLEDIYINTQKYKDKYSDWKNRAENFDINHIVEDWNKLLW